MTIGAPLALFRRIETTNATDKLELQHGHSLLDRVSADQMIVAVRFLEFLLLDPATRTLATIPFEDEEISEEEEQAVARSIEWFKHNEGIPFEQVVAECGFTMEEIRNHKALSD